MAEKCPVSGGLLLENNDGTEQYVVRQDGWSNIVFSQSLYLVVTPFPSDGPCKGRSLLVAIILPQHANSPCRRMSSSSANDGAPMVKQTVIDIPKEHSQALAKLLTSGWKVPHIHIDPW